MWPLGNMLIENLLGNIIDMEENRIQSEVSFRGRLALSHIFTCTTNTKPL